VKVQPFGEEVAVKREVRRLGENVHPAVAALGDVMGNVRKDDTSEPRHERSWPGKAIMWNVK
jgi:hypothetical protein